MLNDGYIYMRVSSHFIGLFHFVVLCCIKKESEGARQSEKLILYADMFLLQTSVFEVIYCVWQYSRLNSTGIISDRQQEIYLVTKHLISGINKTLRE